MQLSYQSGLSLPITSEFRQIADAFALQCPIREKASQIRRNTLAVCAVNAYLKLMDIATDVGSSDSWQPMMQVMSDVADLQLLGVGALSCRAIASDSEACYVPPEAWEDRIGYVAVVLDEAGDRAMLVGFTPSANEQTQVPLSQFAPIEALLDQVHALQTSKQTAAQTVPQASPRAISSAANAVQSSVTQLSRWAGEQLDDLATTGWQLVDQLLNPTDLGFAFRSAGVIEPPVVDISRAKLVNLGIQFDQAVRIALVMHLAQSAESEEQTHITLQVRPVDDAGYLPEGLLLSVLDDEGTVAASATSRAIDNYIQLQFSGDRQEQFSVQITLGEVSFEERFAI